MDSSSGAVPSRAAAVTASFSFRDTGGKLPARSVWRVNATTATTTTGWCRMTGTE